uniref:Small ribosomal subunit protein uS2c n=1 Tax=Characiochloris acuminata TaxID=167768 RepID=A0A0S2LPL5_9CHLO|nr:ribosomal protein S2 [Characiochloris acuminata]ALO63314.1 ribosomal protein S2 [Characiochloris acuminata]
MTINKKSLRREKNLTVGNMCQLTITALGRASETSSQSVGIDEYSYRFPILVPNAVLGARVNAKIVKIISNGLLPQYAIAQITENISVSDVNNRSIPNESPPVNPGDILELPIQKLNRKGAAIAELENKTSTNTSSYKIIVLGASKPAQSVKVCITRVKKAYAFAKIVQDGRSNTRIKNNKIRAEHVSLHIAEQRKNVTGLPSKMTITLPQQAKQYGKYLVLKVEANSSLRSPKDEPLRLNNMFFLFVKLEFGLIKGKVRIKIVKNYNRPGKPNLAVGKILNIQTTKNLKKQALVRYSIRQMVKNGMHFGEKAVKCHARMKNYIWQIGSRSALTRVANSSHQTYYLQSPSGPRAEGRALANRVNMFDKNRKGNVPTFGIGERNERRPLVQKGRHVINLFKTRRCLNKALIQLSKYALKGRTFLFIGTKKPAAGLIERASYFSRNSFFVNTRWLGGMLTNWKTISKSIQKIRPILKEKQKVVRDILTKRQNIKTRLIKKALLLKNKSKVILTKGHEILQLLLNTQQKDTRLSGSLVKLLSTKGSQVLASLQSTIYLRRELVLQSQLLKEKAILINTNFKTLFTQLTVYTKKLRELKSLLILIKNYKEIQKQAIQQNRNVYSISYGKLKEVTSKDNVDWIVPNPPKEILNRIVLTMKNKYGSGDGQSNQVTERIGAKAESMSAILVFSKLIPKFSRFGSYIKTLIKTTQTNIKQIETQCANYYSSLINIKTILQNYVSIKNTLLKEFQFLKEKLGTERTMIRIIKRKKDVLDAQKKLIAFLPRLRYLPTPQTKIREIVQILLKKIVDPKLKYSIDSIYDAKLSTNSVKDATARKKKWQRLEKYFGGIANMTKKAKTRIERNVAIIVGQSEEMNAVRECQKLGAKLFTIVDTNCNPLLSDHIIPANDDSRNSIKYILNQFIIRIRLAQKLSVLSKKKLA